MSYERWLARKAAGQRADERRRELVERARLEGCFRLPVDALECAARLVWMVQRDPSWGFACSVHLADLIIELQGVRGSGPVIVDAAGEDIVFGPPLRHIAAGAGRVSARTFRGEGGGEARGAERTGGPGDGNVGGADQRVGAAMDDLGGVTVTPQLVEFLNQFTFMPPTQESEWFFLACRRRHPLDASMVTWSRHRPADQSTVADLLFSLAQHEQEFHPGPGHVPTEGS